MLIGRAQAFGQSKRKGQSDNRTIGVIKRNQAQSGHNQHRPQPQVRGELLAIRGNQGAIRAQSAPAAAA
eukprot:4216347-Prymnesium_polylepis.1